MDELSEEKREVQTAASDQIFVEGKTIMSCVHKPLHTRYSSLIRTQAEGLLLPFELGEQLIFEI
jgi:hypothetical protein